eukprot:Skav206099  [mRNA]  locus=scaffold2150:368384:371515:- [translate_table: standard]
MLARTIPLAKKEDHLSAGDSRPITILGSVYRLWSKVTCSALMRHMLQHLPETITGMIPHRGAQQAMFKQQWMLEAAQHSGEQIQGVTLDLRKCFNTIDRRKVCALMIMLQFPLRVVSMWYFSLCQLQRYWDLGTFHSEPLPSSTGCPEGDGMSVIVMILLCLVWTTGLQFDVPDAKPAAYADNWTWNGHEGVHAGAAQFTITCCKYFGLSVDWGKTWLWSTDHGCTNRVLDSLCAIPGIPRLQVKNRSEDLGSQVTYNGNAALGSLLKRFEKAAARLARLQRAPWNVTVKAHMVKVSIYPTAFYGAELILVPVRQLNLLRTQVCAAILGFGSKSANPAILLHCLHKGVFDPHIQVVLQALRHAKRFLHGASDKDRELFLHIASRHGTTFKVQGPASAFREYLARIGIQCDAKGNLHVGQFPVVNLLDESLLTIERLILLEWQKDLLVLHTDRSHIGRSLPVDREAMLRQLASRTPQDRLLLLREMSGGFQTRHQQQMWDTNTEALCEWCQQEEDTREHRTFRCTGFANVREPFRDLLASLEEDFPFMCHLPAQRREPTAEMVEILHMSMPKPVIDQDTCKQLVDLYGDAMPCFFTDGSSFSQDHPSARHRSYSVVADLAVHDDRRREMAQMCTLQSGPPPTFQVIALGRLRGRQQIPRAEFAAVLCVMAHFAQAVIFTDSAAVIAIVKRWRRNPVLLDWALHPDFDLVRELASLLSPDHILCKVKAHQDIDKVPDLVRRYRAWGNYVADKAAVEANRTLLPEVAGILRNHVAQYQQSFSSMGRFLDYLVKLHVARTVTPGRDRRLPDGPTRVELFHAARNWRPRQIWAGPDQIDESMLGISTWGLQLMWAVQQWIMSCSWPLSEEDSPMDRPVGISWAEISLAIVLQYGAWLPLRRQSHTGQTFLFQPRSTEEALRMKTSLGEQARTASILVTQFRSLVNCEVIPDFRGGKVRSLMMFGFGETIGGLPRRPSYEHQDQVCDLIHSYVQERPKSLAGLPQLDLSHTEFDVWPECFEIFHQPWLAQNRQLAAAQKAMQSIRSVKT